MSNVMPVVLALLLLAAPAASAPGAGGFRGLPEGGVPLRLTIRLLRIPVAWLTLPLRPFLRGSRGGAGLPLVREDGWTRVGVPLGSRGLGVYLEVTGQAQFGRVEIVFEDGDLKRLELKRDNVYGRGIYRLASFDGDRQVMLVRMEARARSARARMRVLLGR